MRAFLAAVVLWAAIPAAHPAIRPAGPVPADTAVRVLIPMTDGTIDTAYITGAVTGAADRPLVVLLHSWGSTSEFGAWPGFESRAVDSLGWVVVRPNFRGMNDHPAACGSERAQLDILAVTEWTRQHYGIDKSRVSLVGGSGGGHMALLMAGRYPARWRTVSTWVAIADLWTWRHEKAGKDYWGRLDQCTGGDRKEYRKRSPITWLANARSLAIDIGAGVNDSTVPYHHSVDAFNAITGGLRVVRESKPVDPLYRYPIVSRRTSGNARLTLFEGVHEGLILPTLDWIQRHQ